MINETTLAEQETVLTLEQAYESLNQISDQTPDKESGEIFSNAVRLSMIQYAENKELALDCLHKIFSLSVEKRPTQTLAEKAVEEMQCMARYMRLKSETKMSSYCKKMAEAIHDFILDGKPGILQPYKELQNVPIENIRQNGLATR